MKIFKKKKPELDYPSDFAIVDLSSVALELGLKDDFNKVIIRYFYNSFGFLTQKKYPYSQARIKALRTVYKIPVFDKTEVDAKFPVFAKLLPSEIKYTTTA